MKNHQKITLGQRIYYNHARVEQIEITLYECQYILRKILNVNEAFAGLINPALTVGEYDDLPPNADQLLDYIQDKMRKFLPVPQEEFENIGSLKQYSDYYCQRDAEPFMRWLNRLSRKQYDQNINCWFIKMGYARGKRGSVKISQNNIIETSGFLFVQESYKLYKHILSTTHNYLTF